MLVIKNYVNSILCFYYPTSELLSAMRFTMTITAVSRLLLCRNAQHFMYSTKTLSKPLIKYKQRQQFRFETRYKTVLSSVEKSRKLKTNAQYTYTI